MKIIRSTRQRIYRLTGLAILMLFLITWDSSSPPIPGFSPPPNQNLDIPESYLINIRSTHYDETGTLTYELTADQTEHLLISEHTKLTQPTITYFTTASPWQVHAENGTISQDGNLIELTNNVVLQQKNTQSELHTQYLSIKPNDKIAETTAEIVLRSREGVTRAVGMQALLDRDLYKLQSNVVGLYEKNPPANE